MERDVLDEFRRLHVSGCFVMPNPWDVGSAVFLEHLGFQALATTSAGLAFARGLPDATAALSLEVVLAHAEEIVRATRRPVSVDFQDGYAATPDEVAEHVAMCLGTGAAGVSIEDATGDPNAPLYERDVAVERVRAACAGRAATEPRAVVTARCEAWLVGADDPERLALDRLVAFADAGADCLFAPGVQDPAVISEMVTAVAPTPVNVLLSAPSADLSLSRLTDLGVRRISVGSALARVAWGAFARAARAIETTGTFDSLAEAAPFAELNDLFGGVDGVGEASSP